MTIKSGFCDPVCPSNVPAMQDSFYSKIGKRCFDASCALTSIVLFAPFLLIIAIAVFATSGVPIFFRQERTGHRGKPFLIWKFRTMTAGPQTASTLVTAANDSRVTPFGRWLRRSKFDELPQLLNVLMGDMSLVGPRPEVPYYTKTYTSRQAEVLKVRPGITGPTANEFICEEILLAQVKDKEHFYVSVLLPRKLESDLQYVRSISFNRDLKLIAFTFLRLLVKSRSGRNLTSTAAQHET